MFVCVANYAALVVSLALSSTFGAATACAMCVAARCAVLK
jgi:hypothetical protein